MNDDASDVGRPSTTKALLGWIGVGSAAVALIASTHSLWSSWGSPAAKPVQAATADDDYTRMVSDKVTTALLSGDAAEQQRALALVVSMPAGSTRDRLLQVLASRGAEPTLRSQATQASAGPAPSPSRAAPEQQAEDGPGANTADHSPSANTDVLTWIDNAQPKRERSNRLVGKVDVFWCATPRAADAAGRIGGALVATHSIDRVQVRPLPAATNARADYQISGNIVRFDPGEEAIAATLARLATNASGRRFDPAPALPGSPSIDYLSVFVCG